MNTCDVLVAGGGPAGSSCARKLRQAGLDVIVMDRAAFPRDKVCAGWITPQVVSALDIDIEDYRRGRTCQAITGFRTGVIGRGRDVETSYDRPVSFGIRRCEFDHYLLLRSCAHLMLGAPIVTIRRHDGRWIVNESVEAAMLVGAGGHFCPVAKWLNPALEGARVVVAQEAEFSIASDEGTSWRLEPDTPELYFCRDLKGYGWCFRKEDYVNIGLGRLDSHSLPRACTEFATFLKARGRVPAHASWRWRGHAYLTSDPPRRKTIDQGVMLIGDAAGLAYPASGEGIRPAVESGLLAAATIIAADRSYTRNRLGTYTDRARERFGLRRSRRLPPMMPAALAATCFPKLLELPWFVRHVLLDRWFLHAHEPALASTC